MKDSASIFSKIDHFNENLISNIQGGVIICQFDPAAGASKAIYLSEGWTALTGYTLQELNEQFDGNPQALVYPEDGMRCNREYIEQTSKGNSYQLEYRCRHKNGSLFWVTDRGVITSTEDGFNQNQSIITNINPIKESEEKLRMSEARFRVAINASHAAVFEFDIPSKRYLYLENADVVFHTDARRVISAYDAVRDGEDEMSMEKVYLNWFHPDDVPRLLRIHEKILNNGTGEGDVRLRQPDGEYIWCKLHCAAVKNEKSIPVRIVGHLVDIEEQHRQTERLQQEAQTDALTGVYNKAAIRNLVEDTLEKSPDRYTLFMLDIDNFKGVNDQLGHLFGDAVLMDASSKLRRLFCQEGVVGRIGGDEFIVFLQNACTMEKAVEYAEAICGTFRHTYSGEKNYKISCSVGVAISAEGDSFDALLHKADVALYQAKALGKDRYVIYNENQCGDFQMDTIRINQTDNSDSGQLQIKERIFELLYGSADFSGSVNMILALLGRLLGVNHIYIFQNTADHKIAESVYEWCSEDNFHNESREIRLPVAELNYYEQFNESGIFYSPDVQNMTAQMYNLYRNEGICSTFQVAIVADNRIQGFMRYDSEDRGYDPSPEQIEIMVFAAKVTGTFIIKKCADESVKLFNQNKMEALDKMPNAIYVIDDQYRLQYMNNLVLNFYPDVELGQKCHQVFMQNDTPCENCPAADCQNEPCSTEIYNSYSGMWLLCNASQIRWSGRDHMRLVCCQIINQYKE